MSTLAPTIIRPGHISLSYAEKLLTGITPDIFARKPRFNTTDDGTRTVDINHPAFCLGHLSLYPSKVLAMCGLDPAPAAAPEARTELFDQGKECRDDPHGNIYPAMAEITERFFAAHRHALEVLATVPDDVLQRENPVEGRMREMLPTVATAAAFLLGPHPMMHLGQISAWRRCFALPPAM